jgi:hypothetical protein
VTTKLKEFTASLAPEILRKWRGLIILSREQIYHQRAMRGFLRGLNTKSRTTSLIISLTTIPERFTNRTYLAIASLLSQSFPADGIVLWVSDALKDQEIPKNFDHLLAAGLHVEYCPDVGPHTKLIYALEKYPDSIIVTADDDRLYPPHWLAELYASYQQAPTEMHCHRAHLMRMDGQGKLMSYNDWGYLAPGVVGPSNRLFQTGTSGVLYPPGCLADEVFNVEVFRSICASNDDIWFKAMALLNNVSCKKVRSISAEYPMITHTQERTLIGLNSTQNDTLIRAVFSRYDLYRYL